MKKISILTPCFNEEENVRDVYERVRSVMETLPAYAYEHLFIDNASTDRTVDILRDIARGDRRLRVIVNTRNFGPVRSPMHAVMQATGDAVIGIVADLQDPPELIREFIAKWEEGFKVVMAVKRKTDEGLLIGTTRRTYYKVLRRLSDVDLVENYTGFGLYDRQVIDILRQINDPYPYFRGLIAEMGFATAKVLYDQPSRKRGKTKNNFFSLYDMAMLGLTSYSNLPLRFATMLGFAMSGISFLVGMGYLIYKLFFWKEFTLGIAPILVAVFFLGSIQLFFTGILGEYIGGIYTHVRKRPLVVEKERINFDPPPKNHAPSGGPAASERTAQGTSIGNGGGEEADEKTTHSPDPKP